MRERHLSKHGWNIDIAGGGDVVWDASGAILNGEEAGGSSAGGTTNGKVKQLEVEILCKVLWDHLSIAEVPWIVWAWWVHLRTSQPLPPS